VQKSEKVIEAYLGHGAVTHPAVAPGQPA
jgi:hypothetical protein